MTEHCWMACDDDDTGSRLWQLSGCSHYRPGSLWPDSKLQTSGSGDYSWPWSAAASVTRSWPRQPVPSPGSPWWSGSGNILETRERQHHNIHILQLFWVMKRFRWQKICFHPTHLLLWTLNRMKSLVRHFTARVINVLVVSVLTGCEYPNISIRALAYTDKYIREGPGHSSRYIHTVRTTDTGHARIRRQHLDLGSRNLFFATQIFAFPVITHFISGPKIHQKRKEVKLARPIKGLGLLYPISNPAFHPYVIEWPNSPNSQIDF